MRGLTGLMLAWLVGLASGAAAVDGVIEISQAKAGVGSINGDAVEDPPGFPVTITQAGSYRLTGNLVVPANTTAIRIEAGNVTLDLGGFEIKGPNTCTGYPVTSCTATNGAGGIVAPTPNEYLAVVRNGRVIGMAGACIDLAGNSSSVEQVSVFYCGGRFVAGAPGAGIQMGAYGRVSRSHSSNSFGDGILIGDGGTAIDNETRGNAISGVSVGGAHGGSMIGNRLFDNGSAGLVGGPSGQPFGLASKNLVSGNGQTIIRAISLGDNLCNGLFC